MMIGIERFAKLMEQAVHTLPTKVFEGLNLGIGLVEGCKSHRETASGREVYVLGEYHARRSMGRGIVLYYGSFARVYPGLEDEAHAVELILGIIKHELTHHLESLAGENDLAMDDKRRLEQL